MIKRNRLMIQTTTYFTALILLVSVVSGCKKDSYPDVIFEFLSAIESEDYDKAEWYLKKYRNIEKSSVKGIDGKIYAPAIFAATRNDMEAMKLLIRYDVDLTKKDHLGATALHHAISNRSVEISDIVLKNDPSIINARDNRGDTALSMACNFSDIDDSIIENLLNYGADPNIFSMEYGYAPLNDAVAFHNASIVGLLLDHGADPFFVVEGNKNAIIESILLEKHEIFDEFLKRNISMSNGYPFGVTPLHTAALIDDAVLVKRLVEYGVDINLVDDKGLTPLEIARNKQEETGIVSETVKYLESL